jgi:tetratricopeptide (TPR) repeat protein
VDYGGPSYAPVPQQDPYSFSGQVDMPDGSTPPEPPIIQSVCGSRVQTVAYCDRKGNFSFSLVNNPWGDPWFGSWPFGSSGYFRTLSSCGLRAYLSGYFSPLYALENRGPFSWPSVGKFRLNRPDGIEGSSVSLTTLAAPKLARKHFEKALKYLSNARLEKAAAELEAAVNEYPEYAAAWALLGEVRQQLRHEWGIREAFERALEADAKYLRPYAPLIRIEIEEKNFERVAELAGRAIRLNPLSAELRLDLALAEFMLGDLNAARYSVRRALEADDIAEHPEAYALYGKILAKEGDRAAAAEQYRRFLTLRPNAEAAAELRSQLRAWGELPEEPVPQQAEARK